MFAIRAERDYVIQEDFMKVYIICIYMGGLCNLLESGFVIWKRTNFCAGGEKAERSQET